MRPGGPLQSVPAFAGKLPDHGSRIAALLTVADRAARGEDPLRDPIPGWAMESAERLIAAISTHVVKVTGDAGVDPMMSDLLYLWERAVEMEGSTESDIRDKARARQSFRDAGYSKKMFDELEQRGFIRRVPQPFAPGPGRPPSPRIEINPNVRGSNLSNLFSVTPQTSNKLEKLEGGAGLDELSDRGHPYLDTDPEPASALFEGLGA